MVLTPVLRPIPNKKDWKYVMIRIHNGGNSPRYKTTGHKIKDSNWNKNAKPDRKNWVKTTESKHREINDRIEELMLTLREELEGNSQTTLLKETRNTAKGSARNFLKYAHTYLELVRNQSTKSNVEQGILRLEKYLESIDQLYLTFDNITKQFCKRYYNHLLETNKSNSSVNQYFGIFRTIYNEAAGDETLSIELSNPFEKFKYIRNKTINEPLTQDEFLDFLYLPTPKRKWQISKNIFLFQFTFAFRINEVICLQWQDIKYIEEQACFSLDKYTSKATKRVKRKFNEDVAMLLVPGIERYFPEVIEKLGNIEKERQDYQKIYDDIKQGCLEPLTTEDMLLKLQSGYSGQELLEHAEKVKKDEKLLEHWQREIDNHNGLLRLLLRYYILQLKSKHPKDFVWDQPQREGFDINRMNKEDFKAYKRCLASNHGYLKRMQKEAGIKTDLHSHVARYTASNFLFKKGVDFNLISKFLTHSTQGTTELYVNRQGIDSSGLSDMLSGHLKTE